MNERSATLESADRPAHGERRLDRARADGAVGCPVCGRPGRPFRSAEDIGRDLAETERHHAGGPLKLMRDEAVPLVGCDRCGTLWRSDPTLWHSAVRDYEHDRYDTRLLERLHEDEVEMARQDQRWMVANGVRPGRRLLEVASYVGGFLAFAGQQGAAATGVDPNRQLVGWCRARGLDARAGVLERVDWEDEAFDGVWILNCFDQVAAPADLLAASHRRLRPGGRLVIRTPNAAFVRAAYGGPAALQTAARHHALWGVPHLCCYTVSALSTLVRRAGFAVTSVRAQPGDHGPIYNRGGPPWFDLTAASTA